MKWLIFTLVAASAPAAAEEQPFSFLNPRPMGPLSGLHPVEPAENQTPRKLWINRECSRQLASMGDGRFILSTLDGHQSATCRIEDWPVSEPVAKMRCEDGNPTTMAVWSEGTALFAGIEFLPKGDKRILCD